MAPSAEAGRATRVLHFPANVGGHPGGLAAAERALGAASTMAVLERSWLAYPVDVDLGLGGRSRWRRLACRAAFALRSASRYDVFHFNFGQSLLPRGPSLALDMPLLRAAGKRLFMTFQGSDARPLSAPGNAALAASLDRSEIRRRERRRVSSIRSATRWCHRVFCLNPDLANHVPGAEFVPYASVDIATVVPERPARRDGPIAVVHAPTSRAIKGTAGVEATRRELEHRSDVVWSFVEGTPHAEALQRYREADIAIDQLEIGWYGGFAVELMAMGKPVICFIDEHALASIPAAMAEELPVVRATGRTLTAVLGELLDDPGRRADLGRRGRAYVERWHDPIEIARRMLRVYDDPGVSFWDGAAGGAV